MSSQHPQDNRALLLAIAGELLDLHSERPLDEDAVLTRAGLTPEQLRKSFEDFDELLEAACLERYMLHMTYSIQSIRQVVNIASSQREFREGLLQVDLHIHNVERWTEPFIECAHIISLGRERPRMSARLAKIQDDVTFGFAEVIQHGQLKGWVKPELDDWTTAVFLESIAFGRLLDGVSATKLNQDEWLTLVHGFVDKVLLV